jgi:ATP-binding cassette subfamily B protein
MTVHGLSIETDTWPVSRLGELIESLAGKSGLASRPVNLPQPTGRLDMAEEHALNRWVDTAASYLGLEAEAVDAHYTEIERLIHSGGPLILQLPQEITPDGKRLVALLRSSKRRVSILCPDRKVRKRKPEALRGALCNAVEAPFVEDIDQLLVDAQVPPERRSQARRAILREQLSSLRIPAGWLLRLSPSANLQPQMRHGGVYLPLAVLFGLYFVQQILAILSWIVIGRGIFQGNFDLGWLFAWIILLLATIPIHLIVSDGQTELSISAGTLFKQRLLFGILKLEPEEIRHQGMGQFLGRVMESEAVEMLAISGGFNALLSIVELVLAGFILSRGAGGALQVVVLAVWVAIAFLLLWRNYLISRDWSNAYREMTNELVEGMVGHRTRLAQEDPERWHDREDQALDRYLLLSERMDRSNAQVNSLVTRGWIIIGLAGIAYPFITGSASIQSLAIAIGGILYASQALGRLVGGSQSLISLLIAWRQVGPLFNAAERPAEHASLDFIGFEPQDAPDAAAQATAIAPDIAPQPMLISRDLQFRYRPSGRMTIQNVSLEIHPGDRLLLEGPSGGGKSTLAALLTGLRKPESGSLLLWGFDRQIIGSQEWRRRVAMAPQFQENHVFSATFGFNLLMGRRGPPTPQDLRDAETVCRELGLGDVLDRMPSGFQQMLGESGWQLSHGERSRLYIARTLLQNADLIILDESFGALDPENLYRAMTCVLQRARTLLVIAHP